MKPEGLPGQRWLLVLLAFGTVLICGGLAGLALAGWLTGAPSRPGPLAEATAQPPTAAPLIRTATPSGGPLPPFVPPTLTSTSLPMLTPALLPNPTLSGKIVYTCFDGNDDEICLLDLASMAVVQLTNNEVGDWYASLTPDGNGVLWARQVSGANYEIFRMDITGANVTQLTQNGAGNFAPELSPDGTRIVYTSNAGGVQQIWLMAADGSNPQQLTHGRESIDPTWAPDGQRIAFASNRSGQRQLWVMAADGADPRQVTDLPEMGGRSAFSADGQALAFYQGPFNNRHIFLINVDGGNLRRLTADSDNVGPGFSPDGQWIAFASFRDGNNELYAIRPDGRDLTRLTRNPRADYQPRWGR